MEWKTLDFGKHEGRSLPQIAFRDPDWLYWSIANGVFDQGRFRSQAHEVARKGTMISIPGNRSMAKVVHHHIDRRRWRLTGVVVIVLGHCYLEKRQDLLCFDLSYARRICPYDKHGSRLIVNAIKTHVFGDRDTYITRRVAEQFFADDDNFGAPILI